MNHEDWVRQELRELSRSLGFRYTSKLTPRMFWAGPPGES